jgi:multidrug transporter EmrE-like cation transporter
MTWFVVLGVEALLAVIAGYFLYAEQLNAHMLGGVALVVAGHYYCGCLEIWKTFHWLAPW